MGNLVLNIQSMIKRWILNYKRRLKQNKLEKQELEKQIEKEIKKQNEFALIQNYKIKKYSRFEIITKVSIGVMFSFFEHKLTAKEENLIKDLPQTKQLEIINSELNSISINNTSDKVIENYNKLIKIEEKLKTIKTVVKDETKQKLLETKKEVIKTKTKTLQKQVITQTNFIEDKKEQEKTKNFFEKKSVTVPPISLGKTQSINLKTEQQEPVEVVDFKKAINQQPILIENEKKYINKTTKEIKKIKKEISDISLKIKTATENSELNNYEFKLKQLKLKLENIKYAYQSHKDKEIFNNLKYDDYFNDNDEFKLVYSSQIIDALISRCDEEIVLINNKILNKSKPIITPEKQSETKEEEKQDNKQIEEFNLAKILINKDIQKQQKLLNDLTKSISKMNIFTRKRTVFDHFNSFLSNTFNFALSIFPLSFFSNKLLGGLISTIMLNNSIKTMRTMITKQKINYAFFNEKIDLIEQYKSINSDTIDQISFLKQEVLSIYNDYNKNELKPILEQILGIEEVVLKQQVKLDKLNQKLEQDKQKIIKMEW